MTELSSGQMAAALRRCGGSLSCEACPYEACGTATCIQAMQKDAAAMIEGMQGMIEQQADTIAKIRTFVRGNK